MKRIELVVPTILQDIEKFIENSRLIKKFLPISKIYIIGTDAIKNKIPNNGDFVFINESKYVDFNRIKELIHQKVKDDQAERRTGWYVQQFVKMAYCIDCDQEYYFLWDSDTVPVRPITMFEGDKPYFDCKTEHHEAYFETIKRLFPEMEKNHNMSFISEHMLIKTEYMKALIHDIELNKTLQGENFQEKIIDSIDPGIIAGSGFSEFETYGTYVTAKYPGRYEMREWHSIRNGGFFYEGTLSLSAEQIIWLGKYYDAISFEKKDTQSCLSRMVQTDVYQRVFSAKSLEYLAYLAKACRKITGQR